MGVDIMFKMRHNLDVSSVDALANGLQAKLGVVARGYFNPGYIDLLSDLGLPCPKYTTEGKDTNIEVEDEYLVARLLIATYGDSAIAQIENNSEYQYYIDQINELNQGLYSYRIHYVPICKLGMPHIWSVTNDAISGAPGFGNERWHQFSYMIGGISKIDNEYLLDLIDSRRKLYNLLKPLMKGEYIYYHADQGEGEEISYINHFDDIPEYVAKINFKTFNLSEYILNAKSTQIYDYEEYEYVIIDDFKDIKQKNISLKNTIMETTHIDYLLSNTEELLITKGDRLLFDDIKKRLEEDSDVESFAEDIFEYSMMMGIDEEDIDYIEQFNNYDVLHFKGEVITKELWQNTIVDAIENRLSKLEKVFPLRESDLTDENAPTIKISVNKEESQGYEDTYRLELIECGLILISGWYKDKFKESYFFSPKLFQGVIDYIRKIDYLALEPEYGSDSLYDDTVVDDEDDNIKSFSIKVSVGDRQKSVYNCNNYNSELADLENYIDDLVFNKLRKYTRKPEKCDFCDSTNITDFNYSKSISEVIVESENNKCHEKCHCVAKNHPAWVCQDCETIYFRE